MSIWRRSFPPFSQRPLEINRRSPQARGIELAIPGNSFFDLAGHRRVLARTTAGGAGDPELRPTYRGLGLYTAGQDNSSTFYYLPHEDALEAADGDFFASAWVYFLDSPNNTNKEDGATDYTADIIQKGGDDVGGKRWKLGWAWKETNRPFQAEIDDNTTKTVLTDTVEPSLFTPYWVATRRIGNDLDLFVNGVSVDSTTHNHSSLATTDTFNINASWSTQTSTYRRLLYGMSWDIRFYKTAIPDALVRQMYTNPYDLYAPLRRYWMIGPAAGGGFFARRYYDSFLAGV